jgi:glycosyltransferase involved in cell wall biosynthesis
MMASKLRIAFVTNTYYPDIGGMERYVEMLAAALSKLSEICVLTRNVARSPREPDGQLVVVRLGLPMTGGRLLTRFVLHLFVSLGVFKYLIKHRPQVVHAHGTSLLLFACLLFRKLSGSRFVLTVHGSGIIMPSRFERRLLNYFSRKVDVLVVASESLLKILRRQTPTGRTAIIPNAVDVKMIDSMRGEGAIGNNRIATVANLRAVKGLEYLLRAIRILVDAGYHVHLDIAGSGSRLDRLKALSASLDLKDRVTFLGRVEPKQVFRILSESNIFAMSSLSDAFPLALLEAMAVGLPVIATSVPVIPDIIENGRNGLLVPPRDSRALARAIAEVLEASSYAQTLGSNARRTVLEHYQIQSVALEHYRLYRSLTEKQFDLGQ